MHPTPKDALAILRVTHAQIVGHTAADGLAPAYRELPGQYTDVGALQQVIVYGHRARAEGRWLSAAAAMDTASLIQLRAWNPYFPDFATAGIQDHFFSPLNCMEVAAVCWARCGLLALAAQWLELRADLIHAVAPSRKNYLLQWEDWYGREGRLDEMYMAAALARQQVRVTWLPEMAQALRATGELQADEVTQMLSRSTMKVRGEWEATQPAQHQLAHIYEKRLLGAWPLHRLIDALSRTGPVSYVAWPTFQNLLNLTLWTDEGDLFGQARFAPIERCELLDDPADVNEAIREWATGPWADLEQDRAPEGQRTVIALGPRLSTVASTAVVDGEVGRPVLCAASILAAAAARDKPDRQQRGFHGRASDGSATSMLPILQFAEAEVAASRRALKSLGTWARGNGGVPSVSHFATHVSRGRHQILPPTIHLDDSEIIVLSVGKVPNELAARAVILAGCWTGEVPTLGMEYALPTTLIDSGVEAVVAAAWPLDDLAGFLVWSKAVSDWAGPSDGPVGPGLATAVAAAQEWVSRLDRTGVMQVLTATLGRIEVSAEAVSSVEARLRYMPRQPFCGAEHWAGLKVWG